jgi:hypothetical protein
VFDAEASDHSEWRITLWFYRLDIALRVFFLRFGMIEPSLLCWKSLSSFLVHVALWTL